MKGKEYEAMCKRFFDKNKDIWLVRKNEAGGINYYGRGIERFTPPKGIDWFIVSSKYINIALEVKYTNTDVFYFKRIKEFQYKQLHDFENRNIGLSFVLLGFNEGENSYLIPIKKYDKMVLEKFNENRKSINKIIDNEILIRYSILPKRVLLKKNYYIDLSKLLVEK